MKLRVLHAATHAHNIGDGALVAGMHATLAEDLGRPLDVTPIDVLGCKLRRQRDMLPAEHWSALEREVDLVLVGGGGMLEGGFASHLSGLNFNFDLALLERSRVPWVFYALGMNQFRRGRFFHSGRVARLLEIVERRGLPFSVRNDGSKQRLELLLGPLPFVRVIPDPGLYVPVAETECFATNRRPRVLVQLSGDRIGARLGGPLARAWRALSKRDPLDHLARVLARTVERHGAELVFCPHLLCDLALVHQVVSRLPRAMQRESCTSGPVLCGAASAPAFFAQYRQADVVIGMRGHSAICAVGLGTPFVGLATHDKIGGFLDELGLGDLCVDVADDPRLTRLGPTLDGVLADLPAARARVRALLPGLRQATRDFHATIGALVDGE